MRLGKYLLSLTKPEIDEIEKICNFTEDEEQIFKCISKGYTLRQIEMKCNMSESTVARRASRIDWKIFFLLNIIYSLNSTTNCIYHIQINHRTY